MRGGGGESALEGGSESERVRVKVSESVGDRGKLHHIECTRWKECREGGCQGEGGQVGEHEEAGSRKQEACKEGARLLSALPLAYDISYRPCAARRK